MITKIKQLWNDEEGPTAVEYALMTALIAFVVFAGAQLLGTNTNATLNAVAGRVAT